MKRDTAERMDADDPLAAFRDRFHDPADGDLIYLDGNSLGRLPRTTIDRMRDVVTHEWGERLIRSWNERWFELPQRVGDQIGEHILGAGPGQVVLADSTTVNFYKLAVAALVAAAPRRTMITNVGNFPTDRYVLEGIAAAHGATVRFVELDEVAGPTAENVAGVLADDTAFVALSHVDYSSGALADMASINAVAASAGTRVLWDLSHSAGAVSIELDAAGTELAVGCTYKYLNAGPGAPAFLYVRRDLQERLRAPIWGWFGQRDQFAMGQGYDPIPGIERFLSGTPNVLGAIAVEEGVRLLAEAGIERLRAKGIALTDLAVELADAWLADLGFRMVSPRDASRRGSHVSLAHPDGYRICRVLIDSENVVPDFRSPDRVRLGLAPITTRFVDVWDAFDRLRRLVQKGAYRDVELPPLPVT